MDKFIGHSDEEENGFHSLGSDEELYSGNPQTLESDVESDEEDQKTKKVSKKNTFDAFGDEEDEDEEVEDEEPAQEGESKKSDQQKNINELFRKSKLLKLKAKKPKGKTGVVYLSKIPPYMKPAKMRQILSRFGEVDRLFLKREAQHRYKQRLMQGGNKKIKYEEGWAEFIKKKDAKICADSLNGNKLGGKKGNFYYDDIMNVKYLSGFKWTDLTEQISRENEIRQSKLQMEISQAAKLNKAFIRNVEKSKMIENIKSKKKTENKDAAKDDEIRRTFEQRKVNSTRADAPEKFKKSTTNSKLDNVLSRVF
ncbi:unnamed protein product [Wickerhamomyces anomalus]